MFAILNRVTRKVLNKKMTLEPRFKSSGEINPAFVGQRSKIGICLACVRISKEARGAETERPRGRVV